MLQHAKNFMGHLCTLPYHILHHFRILVSRLIGYDKTLNRISNQIETLYQLSLLDRIHPALTEKILRLPASFSGHLSLTDFEALGRNLPAALALRREKTEMLLEIIKAAKLLPMAQRTALYRVTLEQADPYSQELAAWQFARLLFMYGLDDSPLLNLLEETLLTERSQDTLLERRKMLVMRIALFIVRGDTTTALSLLERYLSIHGHSTLHMFPPVACLAYTHGIRAQALSEAAFVYENIRKNREEDSFRAYLRDKSFALVGNGPQELGRGRGGEIDAHDAVMRINNPVVNSKYSADYGTKITVWCQNGNRPYSYGDFPTARYLLLPNNCERYPSNLEQNRALALTIREQGRQLIAPSRAEMQSLIRTLGVDYCSVGLLAATLLRNYSPAFSANDVYGMSFATDGPDNYREASRLYYFDETPIPADAYETHSLALERAAFKRLFTESQ